MLGLALCRNILRLPPVAAMTPETLVARIGPTIQNYLTGVSRARAGSAGKG